MRSTVIWSFLSLVTLAAGGLISGCDGDAKIRKSAEGESCDGTADCNDGLKCLQGACYKSAIGGGNEGGEGNGTGGTTVGPPAPVLSSEGESCTKRADCEEGLACFNQSCVMAANGEGGGGNSLPEVRLGAEGETCQVSSDCDDALSCIPGGYIYGPGTPVGFVGVCSISASNVPPTGMNCAAECLEAADCCELPLAVHALVLANSCAELDVQLDGINCASGAITDANKAKCFARDTYCDCADDAWSCEEGACVYGLGCDVAGSTLAIEGCPPYSRSGRLLSACNADGECAPDPDAPTFCEQDDDCDSIAMADTLETCGEGECTCYQESGCYRKCDEDSDCSPGKVCDTDASVCMTAVACETDQQCAVKMNNARYTCSDDTNTCQLTCANDYDCNAGSFTAGIDTLVCGPEKTCVPVGCSTHADCGSGPGLTGVQMFCSDAQPVGTTGAASSAITG